MISYAIQGVAILFFNLFIIVAALVYNVDFSIPTDKPINPLGLFARLTLSVNQGSTFVALATLIASIIRIQQVPPLAELSFIKCLCQYQFFASFAFYIPLFVVIKFSRRRKLALAAYFMIIVFSYFTILFMKGFSTSQAQTLEELSAKCKTERAFPRTRKSFDSNIRNNLNVIVLPSLFASVVAAGFVRFLLNCYCPRVLRQTQSMVLAVARFFRTTPSRLFVIISVSFVTITWFVMCSFFGYRLVKLRRQTKQSSGNAYQDEHWGFGQVTILLLWVPLVNDIFLDTIGIMILKET
jgi:hypothetical protein